MFLKKFCKIISVLMILIGITFIFNIDKDKTVIRKKIDRIKQDVQINAYTKVPYLLFENNKIVLIENNTSKDILDQNYAGIWNQNKNLEEINNIVLAGHNIKSVFRILHELNENDEIKLYHKNYIWTYKVISKEIIHDDDFSYFEETNEKRLTLITCTKEKKKRLIVIATLV